MQLSCSSGGRSLSEEISRWTGNDLTCQGRAGRETWFPWQDLCLMEGLAVHRSKSEMMTTLLESKPKKQKSAGGTIFSVVFHSAIIFFAVYATARAGVERDNEK